MSHLMVLLAIVGGLIIGIWASAGYSLVGPRANDDERKVR